MPSKKKPLSARLDLLALCIPLLTAGACSSLETYPMPTAYTYHGEVYKAPPGPEPLYRKMKRGWQESRVGEDGICEQPDEAAEAAESEAAAFYYPPPDPPPVMPPAPPSGQASWQPAANDLIGRLTAKLGKPTEAMWIRSSSSGDPTMASALAQAMTQNGLKVAQGAGEGPYTLDYSIGGNGIGGTGRVLVTIRLMSASSVLAEESGLYQAGGGGMTAMPMPAEAAPSPATDGEPLPLGLSGGSY